MAHTTTTGFTMPRNNRAIQLLTDACLLSGKLQQAASAAQAMAQPYDAAKLFLHVKLHVALRQEVEAHSFLTRLLHE